MRRDDPGRVLGCRVVLAAGNGAFSVWSALATVAFGACITCAILVLLPRGLDFAFGGDTLLANGDPQDVAEAYRATAGWIELRVQENRRKLDRIGHWLTVGCAMLAAEVILWALSIATKLGQ